MCDINRTILLPVVKEKGKKMNKILLYTTLIIIQLFSSKSSWGNDKSIHEKLRASCSEAVFFFSESDLGEIAKSEFEKHGGKFGDGWYIEKIAVNGCEYHIFAAHISARPGWHFAVYVSSITGKITEIIEGL
jgi:hypothetical protein